MIGYLDSLIHHQDEPLADWVCIPLYFVSKLARDNGIKGVQVGEGSDEQFCGYQVLYGLPAPLPPLLPAVPLLCAAARCRKMAAMAAVGASGLNPRLPMYADIIDRAARDREHFWAGAMVFWNTSKDRLVRYDALGSADHHEPMIRAGVLDASYVRPDSYNVIKSFLEPFDKAHQGQDALTRMIHNEFRLRLPELLLMRVDKISMSVSLEGRVPFLDHELVDFTFDIPEDLEDQGRRREISLEEGRRGTHPGRADLSQEDGFRGADGRLAARLVRRSGRARDQGSPSCCGAASSTSAISRAVCPPPQQARRYQPADLDALQSDCLVRLLDRSQGREECALSNAGRFVLSRAARLARKPPGYLIRRLARESRDGVPTACWRPLTARRMTGARLAKMAGPGRRTAALGQAGLAAVSRPSRTTSMPKRFRRGFPTRATADPRGRRTRHRASRRSARHRARRSRRTHRLAQGFQDRRPLDAGLLPRHRLRQQRQAERRQGAVGDFPPAMAAARRAGISADRRRALCRGRARRSRSSGSRAIPTPGR